MPLLPIKGLPPTLIRGGLRMNVIDLIEAQGKAATQAVTEIIPDGPLPPDAVLVADTPVDANAAFFATMLARDVQIVAALRAADALEKALAAKKAYATLRTALNKALAPLRASV